MAPSSAKMMLVLLGACRTQAWVVVSGNCTVNASSGCVMSPGYPSSDYGDSGECEIYGAATNITVAAFETEEDYDFLNVNHVLYHGTSGPQGIVPTTMITWDTDYANTASGWMLCQAPGPVPVPTPSPTPATTTQAWIVSAGNCTTDGEGCVMTARYPHLHPAHDHCNISAVLPGPMSVVAFNTEELLDTLTVNGTEYSGTAGPEGIVPVGNLIWTSDDSTQLSGWKLCLVVPSTTSSTTMTATASRTTTSQADVSVGLAATAGPNLVAVTLTGLTLCLRWAAGRGDS